MLHGNALLDSLNAVVHSLQLKNKEGLYLTISIEAMLYESTMTSMWLLIIKGQSNGRTGQC